MGDFDPLVVTPNVHLRVRLLLLLSACIYGMTAANHLLENVSSVEK